MALVFLVSFLGVLASVVVGTFWYSPNTPMGRLHMKYLGFDKLSKKEQDEKIQSEMPHMWKTYTLQMVFSFFTAFFIAFTMQQGMQNGESIPLIYGYFVFTWFGFIVPIIAQNLLWGTCERSLFWKKFFADTSYNLIVMLIIIGIAQIIL